MPHQPPVFRSKYLAPNASDDAVRGSSSARGYDGDWKRLRKQWLTEHPICFNCGSLADIVDHIKPIAVDPSRRLDRTNLRSCCTECHAKLTTNYRVHGVNELVVAGSKRRRITT